MKKIINGIRYNTDSATAIGWHQHKYQGDFEYCHETLYVTPRSGRYFISGAGGPMSRWSKSDGNGNISGDEGILPLSKESALEWAEKYLDTDVIDKFFGDLIQDA